MFSCVFDDIAVYEDYDLLIAARSDRLGLMNKRLFSKFLWGVILSKEKQASLKSIADKFGVSVSTVSRVLSGKARQYRISVKTEEKIQAEADRLGFSPNPIASSLRTKKTHTFGLVIPDISNPFFATVARHVEEAARKHGYSIIFCDSQEDAGNEQQSLQLLQSRNVDGLIISPVGHIGAQLKTIYDDGTPVVLLDRYFKDLDIPYVTSNNFKGAFDAIEYLIARGHRNIGCIQGLVDSSTSADRIEGYKAALNKHAIPVEESLICGSGFGEINGYLQAKRLLQKKPAPTALFALGNLITFGVLRAVAEEGMSIPEDVSLISFDDHEYSPFLATPLTSVAQNKEMIGQFAVTLLKEQIDSKEGGSVSGVSLPATLVIRQSVKDIKS